MKLTPFNETFGMPPTSHVSDSVMINSMPVMEITPGTPNFQSGVTLFRVSDSWDQYHKILDSLGFQLGSDSIKLAFIADNFPTDTFSNEYGETFLQKFTDVASQGMQQLAQISGATTGTGAMMNLGQAFQDIGESAGGMMGGIMSGVGKGSQATAQGLLKMQGAMSGNKMLSGAADTINKMLGGHRVDFPQIWRNSSFTPSYTATVRLYNPNPGNVNSTNRHIVGPLAVILCLGIPRSDDGKTFNWPFFHKIKSTGIYGLNPAVITNITVIKGGDQQQISYNQNLGMVDVRIDFTSLYNTMVLEESKTFEAERPTVQNYLSSLLSEDPRKVGFKTRKGMRDDSGKKAGVSEGPTVRISGLPDFDAAGRNSVEVALAKNAAARRRRAPTVSTQEVGDRVTALAKATESALVSASNRDFVGDITDVFV